MKLKTFCLALAMLPGDVHAANPSFASFNTNQFNTTAFQVSVRDGTRLTNVLVAGSLFLGTNSLFLGTNVYTDNATSLLRNGVAVGGGIVPPFTNSVGTISNLVAGSNFVFTAYGPGGGQDARFVFNAVVPPEDFEELLFGFFTNGVPKLSMNFNGALQVGPYIAISPNAFAGSPIVFFDSPLYHTSGDLFTVRNFGTNRWRLDFAGNTVQAGTVTTVAPAGSGNPTYAFGSLSNTVSVILSATNKLILSVGGVKIAVPYALE